MTTIHVQVRMGERKNIKVNDQPAYCDATCDASETSDLTPAQIFVTHESAAPTSDRCLMAPNGNVNINHIQDLGAFYLAQSRRILAEQTTPVMGSGRSQYQGNYVTDGIHCPLNIHKAT